MKKHKAVARCRCGRTIKRYMTYDGMIYLLCSRCEEKVYNCKCPEVKSNRTKPEVKKGNRLKDRQRCPPAATIRRIAYELREGQQTRRNRCDFCRGAGTITVWKLVIYVGKSFAIKRCETVPANEARQVAERIAAQPIGDDMQQVVSAAMECSCRKVVASA